MADLGTTLPGAGIPPAAVLAPIAKVRRKGLGVVAWLSIGWLSLMAFFAIFGGLLPLQQSPDYATDLGPFSKGHLLGTDGQGHDLLARLILGTRSSMFVALGAILIGVIIGGFLGLVAGFFKGRLAQWLGSLFDILLAYPPLVLSLTLVSVFANDPNGVSTIRRDLVVTIGLGVVAIPLLARITRANTLIWSEREFVTAARAMGAGRWRILFRDVLPNVVPSMMSIALLGVGVAVVAEAGLAFLGVGVQESISSTSWGNVLYFGKNELTSGAPHIVLITVVTLLFTVLSLNFIGDVIRAKFDVRESAL
jgi:peptide/nickel transport system permease protein